MKTSVLIAVGVALLITTLVVVGVVLLVVLLNKDKTKDAQNPVITTTGVAFTTTTTTPPPGSTPSSTATIIASSAATTLSPGTTSPTTVGTTTTTLAAVTTTTTTPPPQTCQPSTLKMDVIIMVDVSNSVDPQLLNNEIGFLKNNFLPGLLSASANGLRLFIQPYSLYDEQVIVKFFHVNDTSAINYQLQQIRDAKDDIGDFSIGIAASLDGITGPEIWNALQQQTAIILFASAKGDSFGSAIDSAVELKRRNVTVITAAIGYSITAADLRPLALQPTDTFALDASGIGAGDDSLLSQIVTALCAPKDFTIPSTSASPSTIPTTAPSTTTTSTTTTLPPLTLKMDVIIMVDVSNTVDNVSLDKEVAFLKSSFLPSLLSASANDLRLFIQPYSLYDEQVRVKFFHINDTGAINGQLQQICNAKDDIGNLPIGIGASLDGITGPEIWDALQQQTAIILFASATGANFGNAIESAAALKRRNVTVITAAIGKTMTAADLAPLALQPTDTFALDGRGIGADDNTLSGSIINALRAPKDFTFYPTTPGPSTTSTTTLSTASTTTLNTTTISTTTTTTTTTTTAPPCTFLLKLDLTVLVDVSNDTSADGVHKTVAFLRQQLFVDGAWSLGSDGTQVAPTAYASYVDEDFPDNNNFYSGTIDTLRDQLNHINRVSQVQMGDDNISLANALSTFATDFTIPSHGARPGKTDVLLLFAAGVDADMTSAIQTANSLKQNGTIVMPVAIGSNIEPILHQIAYNSTYSLYVPNVDSFGSLLPSLTNLLCGIH